VKPIFNLQVSFSDYNFGREVCMKFSHHFTVAVKVLSLLSLQEGNVLTLERIAREVDTDIVLIRKIIVKLKKAGLVNVFPAIGAVSLLNKAEEISFFDVYRAVEGVKGGKYHQFHDSPNETHEVGINIELVLERNLRQTQSAMEQVLLDVTMKDIVASLLEKME
jgi:Rrf2 family protein